jgi:hypothetical protein
MPSPFPPMEDAAAAPGPAAFPSPFPPMEANAAPAAASAAPVPQEPPAARSVAATVRLHFMNAKTGTDLWETRHYLAPLSPDGWPDWDAADELDAPADRARQGGVTSDKQLQSWQKALVSSLYQNSVLTLWRDPASKSASTPDESEGDFRVRAAHAHREQRDAAVEKLLSAYQRKIQSLEDQVRRADDKIEREKAQKREKQLSTGISLGATVLGALLGRGRGSIGTVTRAGSTARRAGSIAKESQDIAHAEEAARILHQRLEALETEFEQALADARKDVHPDDITLEEVSIRPRKSDIFVEKIHLA